MRDQRLLRISIVGAAVAALCCFTPVLAIALSALGLAVVVAWLDIVLLPTLVLFAGLAVVAWIRMKRHGSDTRK